MNSLSQTSEAPDTNPPLESTPKPGTGALISELTKARLTTLVLVTTAMGYILGRADSPNLDWIMMGWTMLGTACAAAGSAILNQVFERVRDGLMDRTKERPVPSGRISRASAFAAGVICSYVGVAVLASMVNILAAGLTLLTVLLYILVYTPLKPLTTVNTIVGAVSGALPPMIGWAAATGGLEVGAWVIGGILFVWQLPHFLALAWMYRKDYARGGHLMLPVVDPRGDITAQVMLMTALLLVPVGLLATLLGVTGWWSAGASIIMGLWFSLRCLGFWRRRDEESARSAFRASLLYLPVMMLVMVLDRGSVSPMASLRGGRGAITEYGQPIPESKVGEEVKR